MSIAKAERHRGDEGNLAAVLYPRTCKMSWIVWKKKPFCFIKTAGLDYPGTGPEHSHLKTSGRTEYIPIPDEKALEAFKLLSQTVGIIPALESAHAVAYAIQ